MQHADLGGFKGWFLAATVYNAAWGLATSLFPTSLMALLGVPDAQPAALVQVLGMVVGVYAYAYFLLFRNPVKYANLVWLGIAGKVLGIAGFLVTAASGGLPWRFGFTVVQRPHLAARLSAVCLPLCSEAFRLENWAPQRAESRPSAQQTGRPERHNRTSSSP